MTTVVIPFRSGDPKRRLGGLGTAARNDLAAAMLADVLAAAAPLGTVLVVAGRPLALPPGIVQVDDPGGGQGAAVSAALQTAGPGKLLVVNADLPCAEARDLQALADAVPDAGLALVAAADGTTNAVGFAEASLFRPLYGEGSAARFASLEPSRRLDTPNLVDDVDTLADLARLRHRLGEHTRRVLASLDLQSAA